MITQTTFTNGIMVAMAVMAMIVIADPLEKQKNKVLYFTLMIVGSIIVGAVFMYLSRTFPSS